MRDDPAVWPLGAGEMAARIRAHDWAATPFGPVDQWPERLRHTVELVLAMPYPATVGWGRDLLQIYNDHSVSNNGHRHPAALGRPLFETLAETADTLRAKRDQLFATGAPITYEEEPFMPPGPDGVARERWFTGGWTPIADDHGRVLGMIASGVDTTDGALARRELRATEARQSYLLRLSDSLREIADSVAIQGEATRLMGEWLGVDRVVYAERDGDAIVIHRDWVRGGASMVGRHSAAAAAAAAAGGAGFIAGCLRGEPYIVDDVAADPRLDDADRAAFDTASIAAFIGVGVVKQGRLVASFGVHSATPRSWTAWEIELVRETAERTRAAVERARADALLREASAKYLALSTAIDQGFCVVEVAFDEADRPVDYRFVEVSPAFEAQTGIADAAGRWMREIAADHDEQWFESFGRVARTGEPERFEARSGPNGRWWSLYAFRAGASAKRTVAVLYTDINSRKQAEEVLRQAAARDAYRVLLTDALRAAADPVEAQAAAMRVLGDYLAAARVMYGEANADSPETFTSHREYRRDPAMPTALGVHRWDDFGPYVAAEMRAGRTLVVGDVSTWAEHSADDLAAYQTVGIRAYLAVPLVREGRIEAYLAVNLTTPHTWTAEEVALVEETAERTKAAVERARAESALREAEQQHRIDLERQVVERTAELERSRDLLRATMNATSDMIQVFTAVRDDAGEIVDFDWLLNNQASETVFGEIIGQSLLQRNPGVVPEGIFADFKRVVETGAPVQAERYYKHEQFDGWYLQSVVKLDDGVATTTKDVTEWKRAQAETSWLRVEAAEASVREGEDRFRGLVQGFAQAVWETDGEGRVIVESPSWLTLTGQAPGRSLGSGWMDAVHADDRMDAERRWRESLVSRRVVDLEYRVRVADGSWCWANARAVPLLDAEGRVTKWVGINIDVSERYEAQDRLRESEQRFRQFAECSSDVIWIRDADTLRFEYVSPAIGTIYGFTPDQFAARYDDLEAWAEILRPEDRADALDAFRRVREGERVTHEFRIQRPDDGERWIRNTDFPLLDALGRVQRIAGIGEDVTDLKRAEAAIAESEARLRVLTEGIPQLVWRSCDKGRWTWASPQWLDFTGQTQEQTHGWGWMEVIHPEDRFATLKAWELARPHGRLDIEYRVLRARDRAWVWHHTRSVPVHDADGRIVEWLGTSTDIQGLRELQQRQGVLVGELQHRTRNLIGVVRSMADKSLRASADLPDFRDRFGHRMQALSRVQGLLSKLSEGERVTFDALLTAELAAMDAADDPRVTLDGPGDVALRSGTVQTLALAIHELATNAVKYGALGQPGARLAVRWRVLPAKGLSPRLRIEWRETGVTMPSTGFAPQGTGQGRELIERALPYQLDAETTYVLGDNGVECSIIIPISSRTPSEEPIND